MGRRVSLSHAPRSTRADTRVGCVCAYASASVTPHEPPNRSQLWMLRCDRKVSMSAMSACVLLSSRQPRGGDRPADNTPSCRTELTELPIRHRVQSTGHNSALHLSLRPPQQWQGRTRLQDHPSLSVSFRISTFQLLLCACAGTCVGHNVIKPIHGRPCEPSKRFTASDQLSRHGGAES